MYPGEEFLVGKNPIREKFMLSWKYIYPCLYVFGFLIIAFVFEFLSQM